LKVDNLVEDVVVDVDEEEYLAGKSSLREFVEVDGMQFNHLIWNFCLSFRRQ
jgi:hypothetical protein